MEWDNAKKIADEEKTDTENTENTVKTDNKDAENAENTENTENTDNSDNENTISEERIFIFPWLPLLIIILIAFLSISAGFIPKEFTAVVIALILIAFGLTTSLINYDYKASKNDYYFVSKSTLTAIFTFVFYGLFNGTILPLAGFIVLLISLHFSCCLPEVRFKPRFTGVSFLFIFLPVIYTFAACMFEMSYYKEQKNITNGIFYAKAGKFDMAEQCFKTAININPQSLESYSGLAQTLEAQEKLDEAQDVFEQLDAMVPNIYRSKYNIANILFKKGKILEAHRIAVKNLEWAEDAVSYELLGLILLSEGRQNEAEETFKEGLITVPLNYEEILAADRLRLNLSYLAIRKGDYNKCKTYLDSIRSGISEEIDYQYLKGVISVKEKKYNEALEIYEKLLKLYPNVPRILNATGYVLTLMDKDLDRAQLLIETAYEVMSKDEKANNLEDYLDITNSLGKLYLKQNKLKRAGELLKIAYEETPDELKELKAERLKDLNDFYNSFGKAE